MDDRSQLTVTQALARVRQDLGGIAKDQSGTGVPYKFRGIEQITAKAGPLFGQYGVVAARAALRDAGLDWRQIQFVAGADTITLAQAMQMSSGIRLSDEKAKELIKNPGQLKGQAEIQAYLQYSSPIPLMPREFKYQESDPSMTMQVLEAVVPGGARDFITREAARFLSLPDLKRVEARQIAEQLEGIGPLCGALFARFESAVREHDLAVLQRPLEKGSGHEITLERLRCSLISQPPLRGEDGAHLDAGFRGERVEQRLDERGRREP